MTRHQGKTPVKRSRPDFPIRDRNRKGLERDRIPEQEKVTIMIIMKFRTWISFFISLWSTYMC